MHKILKTKLKYIGAVAAVGLIIASVVAASGILTPITVQNGSGIVSISLVQAQEAPSYPGTVYYYVGRWIWDTTDPFNPFWRAPEGTIGLIDLRSIPQMGKHGGVAEGWGFFASSVQNADYGYMVASGNVVSFDSGTLTVSNAVKNGIRNRLGISETIEASDLLNLVWDLLTKHADITGETRWKPLMPDHLGKMRLYLGGHSLVREEVYDPVKHPLVLEMVKHDYAKLRQESIKAGSDHHRRVLDALRLKYRVDWRVIAPDSEGPLPHETVITDNFNRGDADALGSSSEGWSWTEVTSDTDIVSNKASFTTVAAEIAARAESDLSSDDHYAQANAYFVSPDRDGVAARFASDAATYYEFLARNSATVGYRLEKVVNGTSTSLATVGVSATTGSVLKLTADGSNLEGFDDTVSVISATDTAITGNTRTGIVAEQVSGTGNTIDNFEAGDLAAAEPAVTVSPTSYDFGNVDASATYSTNTTYFTIDNTSTMQTDQTISVTSATWAGGVTWTHSDTATAGADTAGLKANRGGTWGTNDIIIKNASPDFIYENCAASTDYSFGIKLIAPSSFSDGAQKSITVRVSAAAG